MKFKSQVYTSVSGSVGGLTYAHNKGGMYTRGRQTPVNPNTSAQASVRASMAALAAAWQDNTIFFREDWKAFAEAHPITGKFGDPLTLSGQQMFNRVNLVMLQAGLPMTLDASTITINGAYTPPVLAGVVNDTPGQLITNITNTDAWADDGGALLIYASRPVSNARNYFKGPFTLVDVILGNTAVPPTSPKTTNLPYSVGLAARVFVRYRAVSGNGWLHEPDIQFGDGS